MRINLIGIEFVDVWAEPCLDIDQSFLKITHYRDRNKALDSVHHIIAIINEAKEMIYQHRNWPVA